jgi:tetratricopeptide (TPR) repeat protein
MRKFSITAAILLAVVTCWSQSVKDAKKYIYNERYESAKQLLKSSIDKGEDVADARYWLSEIYLKQDSVDAAWKLYDNGTLDILKTPYSKKESPLVYIGWAHAQLDSGKTTEARAGMEALLTTLKYKNADALLEVANANIDSKKGDTKWAIELLTKAIDRDKKNPEIYIALGDAYRKLNDGSNAIMNYESALRLDANNVEALYKEGKIYKTQKNPDIYVAKFKTAYQIDSTYTPVLYELYFYNYYVDVITAGRFLDSYIRNSDPSPEQDYLKTDLLYVSQKYQQAINDAQTIIAKDEQNALPRLYKLIAYSYAALGDSATALTNMNIYFDKQDSSDLVVKDFSMKAGLLEKLSPDKSSAVEWYKKAIRMEQDSVAKVTYMMNLADLQKELGNRDREAFWRQRIFETKKSPTNLDIYKWGLSLYYGKEYAKADSVFALYEEKYPDHVHGYLWRARSSALIDTTMTLGLAVPHYQKLIEVASKDTVANKGILLAAYEYLGGYEANIKKDYEASLNYFTELVMLDPTNSDAAKNIEILKKLVEKEKAKGTK